LVQNFALKSALTSTSMDHVASMTMHGVIPRRGLSSGPLLP
jgi:hypothetical protein